LADSYSGVKDAVMGQQSIRGTGCLNGTFACIRSRAICGVNKEPAEQSYGAICGRNTGALTKTETPPEISGFVEPVRPY
jgi:hypothetical protein